MAEENQAGQLPVTPEWLTVEQAADWLQVSTKTIRRYIEGGSLAAVNLGGRAIRIRREDLDSWLQTRRIEPGVPLHRQEHLERQEKWRQHHPRAVRPPRLATAEELARVNLTIVQVHPLVVKCNNCGTTWTPELRSNGKLTRQAWCCPNGCNYKS